MVYKTMTTLVDKHAPQRLQRIQNSAARLVCAEPAFSHVTPLLRRLVELS